MASSRYSLQPIDPCKDYPTLTSVAGNPYHELMYPNIDKDKLSKYIQETRIVLPDEGNTAQTIKLVDNEYGKIVGSASWFFSQSYKRKYQETLDRIDYVFSNTFKEQFGTAMQRNIRPDSDIELSLMRVLPEYRKQGLGAMLLRWGLEKAAAEKRRVCLLSSPSGWRLYQRYGFEIVATAQADLRDYGREDYQGERIYAQRIMIWTPPVERI